MKFRVSKNHLPFLGKWRAACIFKLSAPTAQAAARFARDAGRLQIGVTASRAMPRWWLARRVAMNRSSYCSSLRREARMSTMPASPTATILKVDFTANARRRERSCGRLLSSECNVVSREEDARGQITTGNLPERHAEGHAAERAVRSAPWAAITVAVMASIMIRALWKL